MECDIGERYVLRNGGEVIITGTSPERARLYQLNGKYMSDGHYINWRMDGRYLHHNDHEKDIVEKLGISWED